MTLLQRLAAWWRRHRDVAAAYKAGYRSERRQCCPYRDPARRRAWGKGRDDCELNDEMQAW